MRPAPRVLQPKIHCLGNEVAAGKLAANVRTGCLDALESLGSRVSVGEVAAQSGLKVTEAEEGLRALAADTLATLEVSEAGEVLYVFPSDPRGTLRAKSLMMRMEPALNKAQVVGEYLVRVAFGTALLVSISLVYLAIFAILNSKSGKDDRRSESTTFYFPRTGGDIFWYTDPYYYQTRQSKRDREMNFLEAVFSLVFGDGDPNTELETMRWNTVGSIIQENGGVVTSEQLAPYLDLEVKNGDDSIFVDESHMVPVLQRFQGEPVVDDNGNLLYYFPMLQKDAPSSTGIGDGSYLTELPWKFSAAPTGKLVLAGLLGVANLAGVAFLTLLVGDPQVAATLSREAGKGVVAFVLGILPLLQGYAAAFFMIPLMRAARITSRNASIAARNELRIQAAEALQNPTSLVAGKIQSGQELARSKVDPKRWEIAYTTEKEMIEQDFDLNDFDRRLAELESDEAKSSPSPRQRQQNQ